jgi:hypothetical protein
MKHMELIQTCNFGVASYDSETPSASQDGNMKLTVSEGKVPEGYIWT